MSVLAMNGSSGDALPVILIFIVIGSVFGAFIYFSYQARKRRREALAALAGSLGLRFFPGRDYGMARKYEKLDALRKGSKRYAFNALCGELEGHPVEFFDYHYQITHSNGKSSSTTRYYMNVFTCRLPRSFPELRVYRESFLEKVAQTVGFKDINFESAEFSKRYAVRSKDRKFAYDFLHARVIEFLLRAPDLNIEIEGNTLAVVSTRRLEPSAVKAYSDVLIYLRDSMPEYVFA